MNVLLTCAGRRNYLVKYFRETLAGSGRIIAADAAASAPALHEADEGYLLPPLDSPDYLESLESLCRTREIRLLLSLNDLELSMLARNRERFLSRGTIPIVSSPHVVDLCFDKWATCRFLEEIGIPFPDTYLSLDEAREAIREGNLRMPLVIKPRWGTASIGIAYPETLDELGLAWKLSRLQVMRSQLANISASDPDRYLLIQEKLDGEEYGLDIVNDLRGQYVTTFVKRKLGMRAGETERAVTVKNPGLEAVGRKIGKSLGHIGNLDCDIFVQGDEYHVLELNPRFGGGYPFSHMAGANLPAALIAWARDKEPDSRWLAIRPGVASAKCDRLVEVSFATEGQDLCIANQVGFIQCGQYAAEMESGAVDSRPSRLH